MILIYQQDTNLTKYTKKDIHITFKAAINKIETNIGYFVDGFSF